VFFRHTCIFNTLYWKSWLGSSQAKWKPWLSANWWPEWADFLESRLEDMSKVPEPPDEWPLDSICRLVAQQRSVSVSQPAWPHRWSSVDEREAGMYSKYRMNSFFTSKMHVCSCIGLQICTSVKEYKFAYQGGRVQFCTPLQRITNLYTFTEDYKFVHLCRVIQICTPRWKSRFCTPLQRITNLSTITEDYKFVYNHRGLQICTPSQRITNLYTFVQFVQFVCLDFYIHVHWQVCTGSLPRSTTATIIEDISDLKAGQTVAVYCDNYSREPVIGNCTQVFDKDIEISWMEGTYTTSWKPWKIRDPQNHRKTIQWTDHVQKDSIIQIC